MALYVVVLLGLLAGAAGQNTKSCSVFGMSRICAAHPIQCSTNCDPKKLCAEPCVKAMVACASDPTLGYYLGKTQVDSIKQMSTTCSHPPSLPAGHGRPGDGTCNLMDLAKFDTSDPSKIKCDSPVMKELLECADNPVLQSSRAQIMDIKKNCDKYRQQGGVGGNMAMQCAAQIQQISVSMTKGGVCCPPGDNCEKGALGKSVIPSTCSAKCASHWNSFYSTCGNTLLGMMNSSEQNKQKAAASTAQIKSFNQKCLCRAHAALPVCHKGGGH